MTTERYGIDRSYGAWFSPYSYHIDRPTLDSPTYQKILSKRDAISGYRTPIFVVKSGTLSQAANAVTEEQVQGLSLAKLLKVGSILVAISSIQTLVFLLLGEPELGIFNPFAALLFLASSPFFYWMGRLAKY